MDGLGFKFLNNKFSKLVIETNLKKKEQEIKTGAERTDLYLALLKNKNIAVVANQTSVLAVLQRAEISKNVMGSKKVTHHLIDYLHNYKNINVKSDCKCQIESKSWSHGLKATLEEVSGEERSSGPK